MEPSGSEKPGIAGFPFGPKTMFHVEHLSGGSGFRRRRRRTVGLIICRRSPTHVDGRQVAKPTRWQRAFKPSIRRDGDYVRLPLLRCGTRRGQRKMAIDCCRACRFCLGQPSELRKLLVCSEALLHPAFRPLDHSSMLLKTVYKSKAWWWW